MTDYNPYEAPRAAPQPGAQRLAYEFSAAQNGIIKDVASWLMLLGVFSLVGAAGKFIGRQSNVLGAVLDIVVGCLMILSSSAFKRIVTTEGKDVANLMEALTKFNTVLIIRIVVLFLGLIALGLIALLVPALPR
jgi:hypothetical protein